MKDRILVFIPMYNCEKQIVRVLDQLKGEVCSYITEVLIVNNRSTDDGEAAAIRKVSGEGYPFRVSILRNNENYGLGGSHKVAFGYAADNGFDYVIVLHGDDQGNIRDFLPLLKSGRYRKYDCCLGGRFLKGSELLGYSHFRTIGNKIFNIIFSISIRKRIYDLGAGLNLYNVNMLKSKYYYHFPDNLTFNCYMLFALASYKQRYMFFPITWREEDQVSNVKMARQAIQTLKMALFYFIKQTKFLEKDARTKKISSYDFTIVYQNDGEIG